ncbi:Ig-like domain-containing protein [Knoellia sp. Soil729]|uniref:Ig-like domain-containing protein n=1 Tax=Knoellia sp. Soil729 TaxID=1736394 RepID=UPI0006F5EE77|nr:Ig-like domain-containing protein [Knoellia sp. Soil729]KRE42970.1 signal peptidase I [Knoellia sp. Soil729]
MRLPRSLQLLLLAGLAGLMTVAFPGFSSATFTASTQSTATVRAAVDWTPPTVSVVSPGSAVKGTTTITVNATDAETGIASVTLEQLAPGAADWVTVCTDTIAPYTCAWSTGANTAAVADGQYSLRARATDKAGYETISDSVRTTVANNVLVVLASPGDAVRGTVPLVTSVYNAPTPNTVTIQYALTGTTSWTNICRNISSPYTCSWNTAGMAAGDYDLRSSLSYGTSLSAVSAVVDAVTVDNTAPSATMVDPGTPVSGTRTFTATATDADSGVAGVVIQSQRSGTSTWQGLCSIGVDPWTCRVDTTTLLDGTYSFRAVATDVAGNVTTSATVANRVVDNTVSSISLDVPSTLNGTVTVGAAASSTAGVASVRIQVAPVGTSTWTDLCTDTTSPYACAWDTTTVIDGLYDLRGILLDAKGQSTTSVVVSSQLVDNAPLRGADVQSANGGATAGRPDTGDTVTFTYSEQVDLTTITSGWNGASKSVTVRFRDGASVGKSSTDDTLDVQLGNAAVNLGSVNLRGDYVKAGKSASFNATMTAGTVTTSTGITRTTVTLRLGAVVGNGSSALKSSTATGSLIWTPSSAVTGPQGRPCSTTPVSETGTADQDF